MRIEDIEVGKTYYYLTPSTKEYRFHPGVNAEVLSVKEKRVLVRFKLGMEGTVVTRHVDPGNMMDAQPEVNI